MARGRVTRVQMAVATAIMLVAAFYISNTAAAQLQAASSDITTRQFQIHGKATKTKSKPSRCEGGYYFSTAETKTNNLLDSPQTNS